MLFDKILKRRIVGVALSSGLLVDYDTDLIIENVYKLDVALFPIFEFLFLSIFSGILLCVLGRNMTMLVVSVVVILLEIWNFVYCWALHYILICWSRFDEKFHHSIAQLRIKEVLNFRLQPTILGDDIIICAKTPRSLYLKKLRAVVRSVQWYSEDLAQERDEIDSLIKGFSNDDLSSLAFSDDVIDEYLTIASLKALWQFLFLIRSELLRLYLFRSIDSQTSVYMRNWSLFKLFYCSWPMMYALIDVTIQDKFSRRKTKKVTGLMINDFDHCVAQIEFVLERLYETKSFPSDARNLAVVLRQAIEILETSIREKGINPHVDDSPSNDSVLLDANVSDRVDIDELINTPQTVLDYEIYEATSLNEDPTDKSSFFDDCDLHRRVKVRSVVDELKSALKSRKNEVFHREREALARTRKIPVDEIPTEELDGDLSFSMTKEKTQSASCIEEHKKVFAPISSYLRPTAQDLQSFIKERQVKFEEKIIGDESDLDN